MKIAKVLRRTKALFSESHHQFIRDSSLGKSSTLIEPPPKHAVSLGREKGKRRKIEFNHPVLDS
jgi:hypothetical protein